MKYMEHENWPERLRNDILASGVAEMQKWTPVTERMPYEDKPQDGICKLVIVRMGDGTVTIGYFDQAEGIWYYLPEEGYVFSRGESWKSPVVAWAELQEPPMED